MEKSAALVQAGTGQSAVPLDTGTAPPCSAGAPDKSADTLSQVLTQMANLDQQSHGQGSSAETSSDQMESSLEQNVSVSPAKTGQTSPETEEEIQIRKTRADAQAKSLSTEEKEFVMKLTGHVNQFEHQMVSIYLDPLVSFSKESCSFEPNFELTSNLNRLCLKEMMTSSKFTNVMDMTQPTFINQMQKHLGKFRHDNGTKQKKNQTQ